MGGLKTIILIVIPGFFLFRTNQLLEAVCEASHPPVFYGALWECMASNQSIRLPAITFVLLHVDRKRSIREQSFILGNDQEVMVHAICMAVQDASVLVQRNALDLLISTFPLHENSLNEADMTAIAAAACSVLLRRDMSLNRRLFNWLLGCDIAIKERVPQQPQAQKGILKKTHARQESISSTGSADSGLSFYFEFYSKSILVDALRSVLRKSLNSFDQPDLRPYRLLITLLDKPEIGSLVIDDIIIDVFRTLYHCFHKDDKSRQELIKSANLLFGTFESNYIWDFCGKQFEKASNADERLNDTHEDVNKIGSEETTIVEMCALIDFLLDVVSIETYVETHSEHLPELFKCIVQVMASKCENLSTREITNSLKLSRRILSKVQPAWNAWDAQNELDEEEKEMNEADEASEMWNQMAAKREEESSPELGREATEGISSSSPDKPSEETVQRQSSRLLHQQHEILMTECASAFQELFVNVMSFKVFRCDFNPDKALSTLVRRPHDTLEERTRYLECLLEERSDDPVERPRGSDVGQVEEEAAMESLHSEKLPMKDNVQHLEQALAISCQILVDLSSTPTIGRKGEDVTKSPSTPRSSLFGCAPSQLPKWLQYLLLCACAMDSDHASLQLQCVSTLLDLIGLLQSTMMVSQEDTSAKKDNNIVIVMLSLMKEDHYQCVMKQTIVSQVRKHQLDEYCMPQKLLSDPSADSITLHFGLDSILH